MALGQKGYTQTRGMRASMSASTRRLIHANVASARCGQTMPFGPFLVHNYKSGLALFNGCAGFQFDVDGRVLRRHNLAVMLAPSFYASPLTGVREVRC
jgi:hypothetical protein